ncbi:hypothetical protein CBR14_22210, partial [Cronobacter sakazakii]
NAGGLQRVDGTATSAVVNKDGIQLVNSGGLARATTVNSGGLEHINFRGASSARGIFCGGAQGGAGMASGTRLFYTS